MQVAINRYVRTGQYDGDVPGALDRLLQDIEMRVPIAHRGAPPNVLYRSTLTGKPGSPPVIVNVVSKEVFKCTYKLVRSKYFAALDDSASLRRL